MPIWARGSSSTAAVNDHLDRDRSGAATAPPLVGVPFSVIGLPLTIKAAPIMLVLDKPVTADHTHTPCTEFFF